MELLTPVPSVPSVPPEGDLGLDADGTDTAEDVALIGLGR